MAELQYQKFEQAYYQESDCMDENTFGQNLVISTENDGVSSGDFFYIKTDRWAFDDIDEVINILEQFKTTYNKLKKDK